MTVDDDAQTLLQHLDVMGIEGSQPIARGWDHIGGVIVDAVLQRRQRYEATVRPRVEAIIAAWPDASTTSGMAERLSSGDLATVIRWTGPDRIEQIQAMTGVLAEEHVETAAELAAALGNLDRRPGLRAKLRAVRGVGPKTLDYLDILTGRVDGVAVDVRVRRVAEAAGISDRSYHHLADVIRRAAELRGWRAGDLDAALWLAG